MEKVYEKRRAESSAVKTAIKKLGIRAKVSHGVGTAWGWLYVYVPKGTDHKMILPVVQKVTGRHNEYDGNISIFNYEPFKEDK
jgi:hypothetical protein